MSQPKPLKHLSSDDDLYPGDEELSQLDLSGIDFLNSSNVQHSPPANPTSSRLTSTSPVANVNSNPVSGTGQAFFVEENAYRIYLNDEAKKSSCACCFGSR
jgi:hypothetical protein